MWALASFFWPNFFRTRGVHSIPRVGVGGTLVHGNACLPLAPKLSGTRVMPCHLMGWMCGECRGMGRDRPWRGGAQQCMMAWRGVTTDAPPCSPADAQTPMRQRLPVPTWCSGKRSVKRRSIKRRKVLVWLCCQSHSTDSDGNIVIVPHIAELYCTTRH